MGKIIIYKGTGHFVTTKVRGFKVLYNKSGQRLLNVIINKNEFSKA